MVALADQVVISGGNFAVTLTVARELPHDALGIFVFAHSAMLFATGLQGALLCSAVTVLGSAMDEADAAAYARRVAPGQRAFSVLLACLIAAAGIVMYAIPYTRSAATAFIAVGISAFFVLGQEYLRCLLLSRLRMVDVLLNDCLSYGLQTLLVLWLAFVGRLTVQSALLSIGATSGVAWVVALVQCRRYSGRSPVGVLEGLRETLVYGRPLVGVHVASWVRQNVILWSAGAFIGLHGPAVLRAAQTLFGPTHLLLNGAESMVPQFASRMYAAGEMPRLRRFLKLFLGLLFAAIALYVLVVCVFAEWIIEVAFRGSYAGYEPIVWIIGIQYLFVALQKSPAIVLRISRRTNLLLRASLFDLVFVSVVSVLLTWTAGIYGAALSRVLVGIMGFALTTYYARSLLEDRSCSSGTSEA